MNNRLQEIRTERKETQAELAKVMGLKTASSYCKIELGYRDATLSEAMAVSLHWGIPIEEIFFTEKVN